MALTVALVCGACAAPAPERPQAAPTATPTTSAPAAGPSTVPLARPSAAPVVAAETDCSEPPRTTDQFRATTVPTTWKLVSEGDPNGALRDGVIAADGSLWALNDLYVQPEAKTVPVRWSGTEWKAVPLPQGMTAVEALAVGPDGVLWAVGPASGQWTVGLWENETWQRVDLAPQRPDSAAGGWMSYGTTAVRRDGDTWTRIELPTERYLMTETGGEVWTLPFEGSTAVRIRDGVPGQVRFDVRIDKTGAIHDSQEGAFYPQAVAVTGKDEFWVLGFGAFGTHSEPDNEDTDAGRLIALRHRKGQWTCTFGPFHAESFVSGFIDAVADGSGGLWAATDEGMMWRLRGGAWTRQRLPLEDGWAPSVNDLVRGPDGVYALGARWKDDTNRPALWRLDES
ncbi:hypothetical protein ABT061_04040 [Streptosporangium sp. NPDC002544]|uniref:hypothetical protein n=1 Tax=Streptosporangium sp. NPDC002544 TaxID=3154538 RepID=UPI00332EF142